MLGIDHIAGMAHCEIRGVDKAYAVDCQRRFLFAKRTNQMKIENPYRKGAYHFTVATLLDMGVNKKHKFQAFAARLAKVWGKADAEGWKAFESREARNENTGKDLSGRILQNCRVLQRTKDYGRPLLRAGAVIDLTRSDTGDLMICLNTKSKKPQSRHGKPQRSRHARNERRARVNRSSMSRIAPCFQKNQTPRRPRRRSPIQRSNRKAAVSAAFLFHRNVRMGARNRLLDFAPDFWHHVTTFSFNSRCCG
jgi:hypothetical protein